jgi:UDP-N-acetylglucosamine 2-epimerase (non-hydrolysing)
VGTRPNFIKVTQFKRVVESIGGYDLRFVHTGQHYDRFMSSVFFDQFGLQPDYFLSLESKTPAEQIGEIITKMGKLVDKFQPDLLIVPGDVNSTLAASITANKTGTKLAHLEAGLRSFDEHMPEEINRILTDRISDFHFATEQSAIDNLEKEGYGDSTHFVGNTMIDTLMHYDDQIQSSDIMEKLKVDEGDYYLMTMHRPANVDHKEGLDFLYELLCNLTEQHAVVFPIHPRTVKHIETHNLKKKFDTIPGLVMTQPLGYFAFQKLIWGATTVITDSGGIQEESTFRQVPCLTMRTSTERPVTCEIGTNELVSVNLEEILSKLPIIKNKIGEIPPLWDGKATDRVMEVIENALS